MTPRGVALSVGARIGEYEVLAPLRTGGMAALYLGRRAGVGGFTKPVAIKVIHPHLADDPAFVAMFLDEARLSARIADPNVVHVEDLGEADGMLFLAMEYVLGVPLSALLARLQQSATPLPVATACAIAMRVADGLHAAHELRGDDGAPLEVVHRDVSPQNILLSESGHVKLIDFGVARARGRAQETEAGALKGKVRYMPPEQAWAEAIDRRADVYALGVVLWEMLVQRRYIEGDNDLEALERARAPRLLAPSTLRAEVPTDLDAVLLTALAPRREERFDTTLAFRRAIAQAVPSALHVEPSDLAALLDSHFARQLASERKLLTTPGRLSPSPGSTPPGRGQASASDAIETMPGTPSRIENARAPETRAPETRVEGYVPTRASAAKASEAVHTGPSAHTDAQASTRRRLLGTAAIGLSAAIGGGLLVVAGSEWSGRSTVTPAATPPTPPSPCLAPVRLAARLGERVETTRDTSLAGSFFVLPGVRSPEGAPAPDAVVEIEVPGEGFTWLDVTTAVPPTSPRFDTVFAVFEGACRDGLRTERPFAFADDHGGDRRARGSFAARGGSLVTLVVSGFGMGVADTLDRGPVGLEIVARRSIAPTFTAALGTFTGDAVHLEVQGEDLDRDTDRVHVTLLDDAGRPVSVVARGERTSLPTHTVLLPVQLGDEVSGGARLLLATDTLAAASSVVAAELVLLDRAGNETAPRRVELIRGEAVGPGAACDTTHRCAVELECVEARCAPWLDRTLACQGARPLTLVGEDEVRVTSALPAGYAIFEMRCAEAYARGREDVHLATVPAGRWDLILGTEPSAERSAPADMVLAVRGECLDARASEALPLDCNDDRSPDDHVAALELRDVSPGPLYVLASAIRPDPRFETGGLEYDLRARLRAIRREGEACDPRAERDRCEHGGCVEGRCR